MDNEIFTRQFLLKVYKNYHAHDIKTDEYLEFLSVIDDQVSPSLFPINFTDWITGKHQLKNCRQKPELLPSVLSQRYYKPALQRETKLSWQF